jgi:hypothetical protein
VSGNIREERNNMKIPKLFFALALLSCGAVSAASSTVTLPANPTVAAKDEEFQKAFRELPEDERQLLANYMARSALGSAFAGIPVASITIAEAIAEQKAFNAKESARRKAKDKEESAKEAQKKALENAVAIQDIKVEKAAESGYRDDTVKVSATVKNLSDKPIAGVKIFVEANDIFGDSLGSYGLKSDATIQPQGEITLTAHYGGAKVIKADRSKVSVVAEPIHIVFDDRSELKSSRRIIGF